MTSDTFDFAAGDTPLLISVTHAGTGVPEDIAALFSEGGGTLPDTDRQVDRLFEFAGALGAGMIKARLSRYVVDLNRDPSGQPLYQDVESTEICPRHTFAGEPIYRTGCAPDATEVQRRIESYWQPYHRRMMDELAAIRERHGHAVILDVHSMRSLLPHFFEGRLHDLNLATARGHSADRKLAARIFDIMEKAPIFSAVRDGRFTGGYIARHYGNPDQGTHVLQLDLAQSTYMQEQPPYRYRPDLAARLRPTLEAIVGELLVWKP